MDNILTYTKAYGQLNRLTPLKFDCGKLCNQACCQGSEDAGMWLFPGEEEILAGETSFEIRPMKRQLLNGKFLQWGICHRSCNREMRPLSCRIFPLVPFLTEKNIIVIDIDPRAKGICPLAGGRDQLQVEFVRKVGQICRELAQEPEIWEFIGILTKEVEEYRRVAQLFGRDL
jgi:hypothetical protein